MNGSNGYYGGEGSAGDEVLSVERVGTCGDDVSKDGSGSVQFSESCGKSIIAEVRKLMLVTSFWSKFCKYVYDVANLFSTQKFCIATSQMCLSHCKCTCDDKEATRKFEGPSNFNQP